MVEGHYRTLLECLLNRAMTTMLSTREAYGKALVELGREYPNLVVLGGDLNISTQTVQFAKEFPERFFDLGAAEQNMMSIAAGLAAQGKIPFVSTFAVFGTGRPFDQLRISIAQNNANVKIVVTHAGIITGEDGMSAQGIEDLSLACSLPPFTVVVPADATETVQAVRAAAANYGPFYIRLSRPSTPVVCPTDYRFVLGKASVFREGSDATIIACGVMVSAALEAAESLSKEGIQCRVLNMATIKPIDAEAIIAAARETGAIVTAEEHLRHGGLGSVVAQVLGESHPVPLKIVALDNLYAESGKPDELLRKYGLTHAEIEAAVRGVVRRKASR